MTTATAHPDLIKRIQYSREDHDYAAYITIDGLPELYIGSADSHLEAEKLCNDYAFHYYADNNTPEVAAQIAAVAFDPSQPTDILDKVFLSNPELDAQPCPTCAGDTPIACRNCRGAHAIQRCPELWAALMGPGDVPLPGEEVPENEGDTPPSGWGLTNGLITRTAYVTLA